MRTPDPQALIEGAAALDLALTDDQAASLLAYLALLSKWNRVYNLTAVRDPSAMLVQHLLDCIAVIAPLGRWSQGRPARILDVGSGAGLPGVVIAALMPNMEVTCVDSVGKKAAFVRQVASELNLKNLHSVHARVESLVTEPFDLIISRAFAALADFVSITRSHARQGTVWLAMMGRLTADETQALGPECEVFHVEQRHVPWLDAERHLIWMRKRT